MRSFLVITGYLFTLCTLSAGSPLHQDILVLIPAYEASQLYDDQLGAALHDDSPCVWGSLNDFLSSKLYFSLRLPNPLTSRQMLGIGPVQFYRSFVSEMTHRQEAEPNFAPYTLGQDFFIYPYDWRQDIATHSGPLLAKALQTYAELHASKTGLPASQTHFILITHSMGGLVARTLLAEQPALAARIDHLYLIGCPSQGSVKAIKTICCGPGILKDYVDGFPAGLLKLLPTNMNHDVSKLVGITRPSLYELLPIGDPHWTLLHADGSQSPVSANQLLQPASWEHYWPSAQLEKTLFLDTWLKDRTALGLPIHPADWEYCQDPHYAKLKLLLSEAEHWRRVVGPVSSTRSLLTTHGRSRLTVVYSSGLSTPFQITTSGTHDASQFAYQNNDTGDGTVLAASVMDDLPPNSPELVPFQGIPHDNLLIDKRVLSFLLRDLAQK